MKIFHRDTPKGPVTTAQYTGPCGSPMAASFTGTLSPGQVDQQLKINRALVAQRKQA